MTTVTKHKRRYCKMPGCARIVKSQGLCQRHGAKPCRCKVPGCSKQAQGGYHGMCKIHARTTMMILHGSDNDGSFPASSDIPHQEYPILSLEEQQPVPPLFLPSPIVPFLHSPLTLEARSMHGNNAESSTADTATTCASTTTMTTCTTRRRHHAMDETSVTSGSAVSSLSSRPSSSCSSVSQHHPTSHNKSSSVLPDATHNKDGKQRRRMCSVPGCPRVVKSKGLCQRHGAVPVSCHIPHCTRQAQGRCRGMCKRHFKEAARLHAMHLPPHGDVDHDAPPTRQHSKDSSDIKKNTDDDDASPPPMKRRAKTTTPRKSHDGDPPTTTAAQEDGRPTRKASIDNKNHHHNNKDKVPRSRDYYRYYRPCWLQRKYPLCIPTTTFTTTACNNHFSKTQAVGTKSESTRTTTTRQDPHAVVAGDDMPLLCQPMTVVDCFAHNHVSNKDDTEDDLLHVDQKYEDGDNSNPNEEFNKATAFASSTSLESAAASPWSPREIDYPSDCDVGSFAVPQDEVLNSRYIKIHKLCSKANNFINLEQL